MKCKEKLRISERRNLYKMRRLGFGIRSIAGELGRSPSTVSREFKRHGRVVDRSTDYIEQAHQAQAAWEARKSEASRRRKLKSEEIRHYVELHLREARWTPKTIAGKLTMLGYPISAEAIYQFINIERPDLKSSLWVAGRSRRRRRAGRKKRSFKQPAAPKVSIELLPKESKDRTEIGHLELDAIIGRKGKSVLQNKVDRSSRKIFLDKVKSLHAEGYADVLINRMKRSVPDGVLKTFLEDNGSEHAEHPRVDETLGTNSYFCHPYCSSERGTVENRNGVVRRWLPKGTNFDDVSDEFIEWVEDYFNNMPMEVLNFKTPNQIWHQALEKTQALTTEVSQELVA